MIINNKKTNNRIPKELFRENKDLNTDNVPNFDFNIKNEILWLLNESINKPKKVIHPIPYRNSLHRFISGFKEIINMINTITPPKYTKNKK